MSVIILIHEVSETGDRLATHYYAKNPRLKLEAATKLTELISEKPQVYQTGLGALATQKRLTLVLEKIPRADGHVFIVERAQHEGYGLTAYSYRTGRIPPKYGGG